MAIATPQQDKVCCLFPVNSIVAQASAIHFFAQLLSVFFDALTGESVATACEPVEFDLLAHPLIERQKTFVP
jgi:hypothetical protein